MLYSFRVISVNGETARCRKRSDRLNGEAAPARMTAPSQIGMLQAKIEGLTKLLRPASDTACVSLSHLLAVFASQIGCIACSQGRF